MTPEQIDWLTDNDWILVVAMLLGGVMFFAAMHLWAKYGPK